MRVRSVQSPIPHGPSSVLHWSEYRTIVRISNTSVIC
jgi:hypothetical protein